MYIKEILIHLNFEMIIKGYVPFEKISKGKEGDSSDDLSISDVNVRIHAMLEGSIRKKIQKCVAELSKDYEDVWLKPTEKHS